MDPAAPALPPLPRRAFVIAWAVFWLLMFTVAVQEEIGIGRGEVWRPLVFEGTSCLIASLIVWLQWRQVSSLDPLLARPWRWFGAVFAWLPLAAVGFIGAVYALRHALFALLGRTYRHEPWLQVLSYESAKFALFFGLFAAVFFGLRSYAALAAERVRAERADALARQAQLLQLAQQIEPHFLFNAIGTITETIHTDPKLADALLTRLASLLRAATDLTRRPETTLDEELRLLEGYASIMRERFADRVQVSFEVDDSLRGCKVPTLLLQPLLENAFRHGVEKQLGPARITVRAERSGDGMQLAVEDDIGRLAGTPRFGTGLANLRERLATRFGNAASIAIEPREGGGVRSRVKLPCVA